MSKREKTEKGKKTNAGTGAKGKRVKAGKSGKSLRRQRVPRVLCAFIGDTLETLYRKGSLRPKVYNPGNVFDEIHVISFSDKDIDPKKVRFAAGDAELFIHPVGKLTYFSWPFLLHKVKKLVKEINPDVLRSFNPLFHGFFAVFIGERLGIPSVVSIHGDFDRDLRYFYWKQKRVRKWLLYTAFKYFVEPYAISRATRVFCAYRFPVEYAEKYGGKNVEVIYNKVYLENFRSKKKAHFSRPTVIFVGRMIPEKNQAVLIEAMQRVDADLLLIGNGPTLGEMKKLAERLGVAEKVRFLPSVQNTEIGGYYRGATIFASPNLYGGIEIPTLEAMAAGLPVVKGSPLFEKSPEIAEEAGIIVDNTPAAFAGALNRLLSDGKLRKEYSLRSRKTFRKYSGEKWEAKEARLYESLFK